MNPYSICYPNVKLVCFHKRGAGNRGVKRIGTSPVSAIGANEPHRQKGQESGTDGGET